MTIQHVSVDHRLDSTGDRPADPAARAAARGQGRRAAHRGTTAPAT